MPLVRLTGRSLLNVSLPYKKQTNKTNQRVHARAGGRRVKFYRAPRPSRSSVSSSGNHFQMAFVGLIVREEGSLSPDLVKEGLV